MKATIIQAEQNVRGLTVMPSGYGHWKIECTYFGRRYSTISNDSLSVDDFNSEFGELDRHNCNRRRKGYVALCECIFNSIVH